MTTRRFFWFLLASCLAIHCRRQERSPGPPASSVSRARDASPPVVAVDAGEGANSEALSSTVKRLTELLEQIRVRRVGRGGIHEFVARASVRDGWGSTIRGDCVEAIASFALSAPIDEAAPVTMFRSPIPSIFE